jgi:hypothetical protein
MKFKISKTEYDAASDDFKKEYIVDGDSYTLKIEGGEDVGALKRTVDHVRGQLKDATTKNAELATKNTELENAIKNSPSQQDIEAARAEGDAKVAVANGWISKSLVSAKASEIAGKISTAPSLLLPVLTARMEVVFDKKTGEPKLNLKDKEGKVHDKFGETDLVKEVVDNPEYKAIIRGNLASGGALPSQKPGGAGAAPTIPADIATLPGSKLSNAQMRERIAAKQAAADQSGGA